MKNFIFLLPLLLILSFSCTKKNKSTEPELPPLTAEGKNILACKVNGNVQIYSGKRSFGNDNGVDYMSYVDKVEIYADNIKYNDALDLSILRGIGLDLNTTYYFSTETSGSYAQY